MIVVLIIRRSDRTTIILGSISSRLMSPRSLLHITAGSLVYPLYLVSNHREAYSTMRTSVGMSFLLLYKCVLERFHIEKFSETQQEDIVNLLEGKYVLVSQPTASEKLVIFSPSRSYASSIRYCFAEPDLLVALCLPLCLIRLSSTEPGSLL